jgi:hypothetical protein
MTEEIVLKLLGLVVVAFVGAANIMKFNPLQEWKEDIKSDLEILSKLDKGDKNYSLVEASVKISIMVVYSKDHKPWYSWQYKHNRPVIVLFSLLLAIAFSIVLL